MKVMIKKFNEYKVNESDRTYPGEGSDMDKVKSVDFVSKNVDQREVQETNWIIEVLENWAETYRDDEDEVNGYDIIMGLVEKLENDTCTKEDYKEILFHIWQAIGQEE